MLEVVEHEQRRPSAKRRRSRLERRYAPRPMPGASRSRDRVGDKRRLAERPELHPNNAKHAVTLQPAGHRVCNPRLPDPGRTGHSDESDRGITEHPRQDRDLALAADKIAAHPVMMPPPQREECGFLSGAGI
jgi:hypothetical protein